MTAWNIKVEGVQKVLENTHAEAVKFDEQAKTYASLLEEAAPECGGYIGTAVADFAAHYQDAFKDIAVQVVASLNGAAEATKAYMKGQQDMAIAAQRGARDAASKQRQKEAQQRSYENSKHGDRGDAVGDPNRGGA